MRELRALENALRRKGITGVGECTAAYGVGSLAVEGAVKELARLLIGQDPFAIERLCYFM